MSVEYLNDNFLSVKELAARLDQIGHDFDPYEYSDSVEDSEQNVCDIATNIQAGNIGYMKNYMNAIIEDSEDDEIADEANTLLNALELYAPREDCLRHYEGELGSFDYNPEDFLIKTIYKPLNNLEYLEYDQIKYIGKNKDCSGLKIPDGLEDCSQMFYKRSDITKAAKVPESAKNCFAMYAGCSNLRETFDIPDSVENCSFMYAGCELLEKAPNISSNAKNCESMYECCSYLTQFSKIPNGVENINSMLAGCVLLSEAPIIPESVKACDGLLDGCAPVIKKAGEWNIANRGRDYFIDGPGSLNNQNSIDDLKAVFVRDVDSNYIERREENMKTAYIATITVPKSVSDNERAIIICDSRNLISHGDFYDLKFDESTEKNAFIMKNGQNQTAKMKMVDLAIAHGSKLSANKNTINRVIQSVENYKDVSDFGKFGLDFA